MNHESGSYLGLGRGPGGGGRRSRESNRGGVIESEYIICWCKTLHGN